MLDKAIQDQLGRQLKTLFDGLRTDRDKPRETPPASPKPADAKTEPPRA